MQRGVFSQKLFSRAGVVAELPKVLRTCSVVLFFAEIVLARRRGVILRTSTSKSVPDMQRGAFFSQKLLSRAGVVQILWTSSAAAPWQLPFFGRACASLLWKTHHRNSYLPKSFMSHLCAVKHLCCATSML